MSIPVWDTIVQLGANTGYGDVNNRQVVRSSAQIVYLFGIDTPFNVNSGGSVHIYKGSPAGNPTSFAEMNSANKPTAAFRMAGVEARIANDNFIHVAFDAGTSAGAGHAGYVKYNMTTDTWGSIETVGSYGNPNIRRYESKLGMAVDKDGVPHVVYGDYGGAFQYSNRIGGTWSAPHQFNSGSWRPSMQFDKNGTLHIAVLGDTAITYYWLTSGGVWNGPETIASNSDDFDSGSGIVDSGPSLVIDKQGLPLCVWTGAETAVVTHIRKRTAVNTWSNVTLPGGGGLMDGHSPSLNMDAGGNLYVVLGHSQATLQPHVNWRDEATQTWHTFDALATGTPDRDGGAGGRYDAIWPGPTNHIDYLTMVEDPSGGGQLAYVHGTPAVSTVRGAWFTP